MEAVLALVIGGLYAAAICMLLRLSLVKLLIGLGLLSHAANLLIFTADGLTPGAVAPPRATRLFRSRGRRRRCASPGCASGIPAADCPWAGT